MMCTVNLAAYATVGQRLSRLRHAATRNRNYCGARARFPRPGRIAHCHGQGARRSRRRSRGWGRAPRTPTTAATTNEHRQNAHRCGSNRKTRSHFPLRDTSPESLPCQGLYTIFRGWSLLHVKEAQEDHIAFAGPHQNQVA